MPRLSNETTLHVEKARDSAFLAVEIYNRPRTSFRSGGYIVLMCIAWTALFHAIFFKRKVKPFYRKSSNRRHFEVVDGDKKAWELSTCLGKYWGDTASPVRTNLRFFIALRNKIEHRSMPGLDIDIFGECQALLFNFEDLITNEFGNRFALNESLSLALQFSCSRNEQQQRSVRKLHKALAKDVKTYIETFRTSLSTNELQDMEFSYKVFLFPKPSNHRSSSDLAVEFVKYDSSDPEQMERISKAVALIKPPTPTIARTAGPPTLDLEGVGVRLTSNPAAIEVRAFSHDQTHPYRQVDLLSRLKALLPFGTVVTRYDLQAVRSVYKVLNIPEFYFKPQFASAQYSEAYAAWLASQYEKDKMFFSRSRERYKGASLAIVAAEGNTEEARSATLLPLVFRA